MKLATLPDGSRDGRLHVVSRDLTRAAPAEAATTMLKALERWDEIVSGLAAQYDTVNAGAGEPFDAMAAMAPLPRAWQWMDASAYMSHSKLMDAAFGFEEKKHPDFPLMYQGMSNQFYGSAADMPMTSEDDGIDFEAEFGVITSEVPFGATPEVAAKCIRLVVQINDWSLRRLAPVEMKTGFGWIRAKPACAMAPVAVTPDELGSNWRDCRVDMTLNVFRNGERFGAASGYEMNYGFHELVAHTAYSRILPAGTVIGGGTVSNANFREVGSSCIAERRGIEMIDHGEARTHFMRFGESVKMEVFGADGAPVFGTLNQKVVKA
ncbi:MAG: fumarylacetoacetate hydrolase [Hoeflea sp.]|uniref:fumarylacetoacetate hydrolase family protein n=1 Tax=Hoeflea sp. TaxID=1940281 RepID=UPI000C0F6674|nr:fumarylacetoacetate hydrolase family protein [Hoeflea sp.]PHR25448.1 MAG: fumarylacetoacetate hydrolase [Hoeflea sp.]